jgi:hypothetical protein
MIVSSRLVNSATPVSPCARPHYSCARNGISPLEAACGNCFAAPFILIFTPHRTTASHHSACRRQGPPYQATRRVHGTITGLFQAHRNPIGRAGRAKTFPPHSDQYANKHLPYQTTAA